MNGSVAKRLRACALGIDKTTGRVVVNRKLYRKLKKVYKDNNNHTEHNVRASLEMISMQKLQMINDELGKLNERVQERQNQEASDSPE